MEMAETCSEEERWSGDRAPLNPKRSNAPEQTVNDIHRETNGFSISHSDMDVRLDEKALLEMKSDEKTLFEMKSDEKALSDEKLKSFVRDEE